MAEEGIVWSLSTSPHINQRLSFPPISLPWNRLALAPQTVLQDTHSCTCTRPHANSNNKTPRSGFPIALAHTN